MSKNVEFNEMNNLLARTNKKLSAKVGEVQLDLSLAHSQVDMLLETLQGEKERHEQTRQQLKKAHEDLKKLEVKPLEDNVAQG